MSHFGLLTPLLVICSLNQAAGEVYYITINSTDLCTVQPCLTLSQFAANLSLYIHSNTTLVFLPGTHYLSSVNLTLSNVDNFVMKSENSVAQIKCTNDSSMYFSQSQHIHITNLAFIGCGGNQVRQVEKFMVQNTKFEGQKNSGTALKLVEMTGQILNSTFVSNKKGSYSECPLFRPWYGCYRSEFVGGAIIATNSRVDIHQSKFEDNRAYYGGTIYAEQNSIINLTYNVFINNHAGYIGGVLESSNSTITIEASEFHDSSAGYGGGVLYSNNDTITIKASEFHDNSAYKGGVLHSESCNITIKAAEFNNNSVIKLECYFPYDYIDGCIGGAITATNSRVDISQSKFKDNKSKVGGAVIFAEQSSIINLTYNVFVNNHAVDNGGVLDSSSSTITIEASEFHDNSANKGGVLYSKSSNITIKASEFNNNSATHEGGVMYSSHSSNITITIGCSNFTKNVSPVGAVTYAMDNSKILYNHSYLLIDNNLAKRYAVIYLSDSEFIEHDSNSVITFSNNLGSLVAFNSNITFVGYARFVNNQPSQTASGDFQEGGAITIFQSNAYFDGACNLERNYAENGGAIHSSESKLYVNGNVTIAHNTATGNGGGVYLSNSELNCQQKSNFELFKNSAVHKGGGLHAISSSIKTTLSFLWIRSYTGARFYFTGNAANRGGGLSLEANAKLYILKFDKVYQGNHDNTNTITFTANSADYGGAVYVDDDTNSGTCASDTKIECFFQVLAIHGIEDHPHITKSMYFSQNYASISGSTLFGGLLDRCAVSQFAEVHYKHFPDKYIGNGENINILIGENTLISSLPAQVCLCVSNEPNCTHQRHIKVKKGHTFKFSVVAVDQIGQPVNATIQISLHFTESGLAEGQLARTIPAECTDLTFNVVSPHDLENLTLYASDGPCKDADLSSTKTEIHFLPCSCPIGLQVSGMNSTNCTCECHNDISRYMEHCDSHTGSLVKQPQSRAWISYINDTDLTGYLVYPNCPFDYCLSISPLFYLNQPNGGDAQCAFNRLSLLCGSCQPGLSLSLGSSHCLLCPDYWPALLIVITIAAILAGIALVALLLVFNITVAVGTLNGHIFYANVVYANKSILLPETNFLTMFISWLNLELGIDTCYFPGMDMYIKTWLQLAFPAYVILLVVLIIIISSYSTKFSNMIGRKDPVATLATLILLSYAKFLEICFRSLSVGILEYPGGSYEMLWLPDATIKYLSGKHIPLFIAAVLILLVGLVYTFLLFSWQWLLYLPKWRIFRWSRNPKIQTFIETYHKPYTPKHRYWTGLLLIARIILYLVVAVNVSNDPTVALTAIIFTVCCIFALSKLTDSRLYRKWPMDVLETFIYLNILLFATFTWYSLNNPSNSNQKIAAYTSVILTFVVLLLIILYHVYTYTTVFSKVKKTKFAGMIDRWFTDADPKPKHPWRPPPDDDIHRFNELLDIIDRPVNADDYNIVPLKQQNPVKPTQSVVEVQPLIIENEL